MLAAAVISTTASAPDGSVQVDGRSTPWDVGMNSKLAYGRGTSTAPRYVWGLALVPGTALRFEASGLPPNTDEPPDPRDVSTADAGSGAVMFTPGYLDAYMPGNNLNAPDFNAPRARRDAWGPKKQPFCPSNGNHGFYGAVFPSFYIDKSQYLVRVNELLGAFVDSDGTLVGKPFVIGQKATVKVPQGAVSVALGLNGESFEKIAAGVKCQLPTSSRRFMSRVRRLRISLNPPRTH